jgi:hypothetical protein
LTTSCTSSWLNVRCTTKSTAWVNKPSRACIHAHRRSSYGISQKQQPAYVSLAELVHDAVGLPSRLVTEGRHYHRLSNPASTMCSFRYASPAVPAQGGREPRALVLWRQRLRRLKESAFGRAVQPMQRLSRRAAAFLALFCPDAVHFACLKGLFTGCSKALFRTPTQTTGRFCSE